MTQPRKTKTTASPAKPAADKPERKKPKPKTRTAVSGSPVVKLGSAGKPMPLQVKQPIERSLGADMSQVRVHDDARANQESAIRGARAFAYGSNIYLGASASPTDLGLMAHEAAHTLQQQRQPTVQMFTPGRANNSYEAEAHHASAAVLTGTPYMVINRTGGPTVQPLLGVIGEFLNDYARHIPGYTLFTVLIEYNPLLGERVVPTPIKVIEGLMGIVPFGTLIFDALHSRGLIQDAYDWVMEQLDTLNLSRARLDQTIEQAKDAISLTGGWDYNIAVIKRTFGALYNDVLTFAERTSDKILDLITEFFLGLLDDMLNDSPVWSLVKKVLHYDPLRGQPVEATTVEILEDFLTLIGKEQELAQMRERGTLQETADWIDTQLERFFLLKNDLGILFSDAIEAIKPQNLPQLADTGAQLFARAEILWGRIWDFASEVASKVLEIIKKALLNWLKNFANGVPGYHLMTLIIGKDVFTGEEVPLTPTNLIRGFIGLIPGGEEKFQEMNATGVVPAAAQRIETLMTELGISWEFAQRLFLDIWQSFSIEDLIHPVEAFERTVARFGEPISRLFTFVSTVIKILVELMLQAMNFPFQLLQNIVVNMMQAIDDIREDPIEFLLNLARSLKEGFGRFFDRFLTHLLNGIVDWIFLQLRDVDVEPPSDLSFESILGFVLDVLGISMENIWSKLAERIGQENVDRIRSAIDTLTGIWTFIQDVQERGIVAIWERIQDQLSNLWDTILEQIQSFVMERIVNQVMQRLLSMLDPTGIMLVIRGFQTFFSIVQSIVQYIQQMLQIVNDFVMAIAAIAQGDLAPGAEKVEGGLAAAMPVAIGFLANMAGLGDLGQDIVRIVRSLRQMVDNALNWLIDRAIRLGQGLLNLGRRAVSAVQEWWQERKEFRAADGSSHSLFFQGQGEDAQLMVASTPKTYQEFIQSVNVSTQPQNIQDAYQNAIRTAQRIDQLKRRPSNSGVQNPEIIERLNELTGYTAILAIGQPGVPPSVIEYGALNSQQGATFMNARILSQNHVRGSSPTDEPLIWQKIKRRILVGTSREVAELIQGHLLNEKIGGPGRTHNLTPLVRTANSSHETSIESVLKRAIDNGDVVRYRVDVLYGGHPAQSGQAILRNRIRNIEEQIASSPRRTTDPNDPSITRIGGNSAHLRPILERLRLMLDILVYEQENLARAFIIDWAYLRYDAQSGTWVDDQNKPAPPINGVTNQPLPGLDSEIRDVESDLINNVVNIDDYR